MHRTHRQCVADQLLELLIRLGNAAALSAEGVAGPDDNRQAGFLLEAESRFEIPYQIRMRHIDAQFVGHRLETPAVFGQLNRVDRRSDHLHSELFQCAGRVQFDCQVQGGLAAHRRQDCIRTLLADNLADILRRQGFGVNGIGNPRSGHNGGRIRVDQNNAVALLFEGMYRLGSGIVELAGLSDDDRPRAYDKDAVYIFSGRHNYPLAAAIDRNSSNTHSVSFGPGAASGWNCTEAVGRCRWRIPSMV